MKFLKNLIEWMIPFEILSNCLDIIKGVMQMLRGEADWTEIVMLPAWAIVALGFAWLMRHFWRNVGSMSALASEGGEAYFRELGELRVYRPLPTLVATLVLAATCLSVIGTLPVLYLAAFALVVVIIGEFISAGLLLASWISHFLPILYFFGE